MHCSVNLYAFLLTWNKNRTTFPQFRMVLVPHHLDLVSGVPVSITTIWFIWETSKSSVSSAFIINWVMSMCPLFNLNFANYGGVRNQINLTYFTYSL